MQEESSATGGVSWAVMKAYITALGGWPAVTLLLTVFVSAELFRVGATVWLSIWTGALRMLIYVREAQAHTVSPACSQSVCLVLVPNVVSGIGDLYSCSNAEDKEVLLAGVHTCDVAGEEPDEGQPEKHSSLYYMGIYAAISGAQLMLLQINFYCVVTFGIRAGRCEGFYSCAGCAVGVLSIAHQI